MIFINSLTGSPFDERAKHSVLIMNSQKTLYAVPLSLTISFS
jgi:hypothetical protein